MRYSIVRVSGPMQEPVSLAEARTHLRVDSDQTADDSLISDLISVAREMCEEHKNQCFCWSTFELRLDAFPTCGDQEILLPRPPVISVESIHYIDQDGVLQLLGSDNYKVTGIANDQKPARIEPAYGLYWPATRYEKEAVTITFNAGYPVDESGGSPTDFAANVPARSKAAIKLSLGSLYRNRDEKADIPEAAKALLGTPIMDFRLSA